jgi:hypothetical protein
MTCPSGKDNFHAALLACGLIDNTSDNNNDKRIGRNVAEYLQLQRFLRDAYSLEQLMQDYQDHGIIDNNGNLLTRDNPFASIVCGIHSNNNDESFDLSSESYDPNDEFCIIKKCYPDEVFYVTFMREHSLEQGQLFNTYVCNRPYTLIILRDTHWTTGNVLTMGFDDSRNRSHCLELCKRLRLVAKSYVNKYTTRYHWSLDSVCFFFHITPNNSIYSLHLHIFDIYQLPNEHQYHLRCGISLDDVIAALEIPI